MMTLAERVEGIADHLGFLRQFSQAVELRAIAAEVRKLVADYEVAKVAEDKLAKCEAREQARLSGRAYSASPTGYGGLTVPVSSANHCSEWPPSHRDYPRIPGWEDMFE